MMNRSYGGAVVTREQRSLKECNRRQAPIIQACGETLRSIEADGCHSTELEQL